MLKTTPQGRGRTERPTASAETHPIPGREGTTTPCWSSDSVPSQAKPWQEGVWSYSHQNSFRRTQSKSSHVSIPRPTAQRPQSGQSGSSANPGAAEQKGGSEVGPHRRTRQTPGTHTHTHTYARKVNSTRPAQSVLPGTGTTG